MTPIVTVVRTGVANTASVRAALERCGTRVEVSHEPARLEEAQLLVLPGVGSFGAGIARLRSTGAAEVIVRRVRDDRPVLGVCLGMQLLCAGSDEAPGEDGLGLIEQRVRRFGPAARTPQFGWNRIEPAPGCTVVRPGMAYFANTFRLVDPPEGWAVATSWHDGSFVAAIERGCVVACQFHPELSGAYGRGLLTRWISRSLEVAPC